MRVRGGPDRRVPGTKIKSKMGAATPLLGSEQSQPVTRYPTMQLASSCWF
ncbi:hypothetical protein N9P82_01285 [bacterium]|nr:hypothetical protein [bacterium]